VIRVAPVLDPSIQHNPLLNGEQRKAALEVSHVAPRNPDSDVVFARADEAFLAGRRLYQSGKRTDARIQFDRAVDLYMQAYSQTTDKARFQRRFEETIDTIHRYDLAGLDAGVETEEPGFAPSPLEDILEMTFPVDPKLKSRVKAELQATVSQLPLTLNDSVLGFIQFFSGRGYRTMVAGLERSGRYAPMIRRILSEEGIPQELIHLAQAESGFLPRAVSRKKATGMWQFMGWRGKEYGLEQNAHFDDRLDPEKATRAAARHLRDLYEQFGDWYLAVAAYNCGPGNVERAVERSGYADFWELRNRRLIPMETSNYVPIILAMTIMTKNAEKYNLDRITPEAALEYDVIEMTHPTHLALIADLAETPASEIQALNPALLRSIAPTEYAVRVPKGRGSSIESVLRTIPGERRASWRVHRVGAGDTLAGIGKLYGETPNVIAAVNELDVTGPDPGDLLVIPKARCDGSEQPKMAARKGGKQTVSRSSSRYSRSAKARKTYTARPSTVKRGTNLSYNRARAAR
jgi:membrane-bound lytic murein transglycosylase D